MRVIKALLGLVFTIIGLFLLWGVGMQWYDFRVFSYISFIIGLLLTAVGSYLIAKAFKGNQSAQGAILLKHHSTLTILLYVLLFIQCCVFIFQIYMLLTYDTKIEPYMPTITREGDDSVEQYFSLGAIVIPFLFQLVFLPGIWIMVIYTARNSWRGACISLISTWVTAFSWSGSLTGFLFAVATYD